MNIIFMGTPDFAIPALKTLIESEHSLSAVFTQPDKPKGRGHKLTPPPVKVLAEQNGITVYQPESLKKNADEYISIINDIKPDIIVVAAYGKILPKEVLDIPRLGCVNIHGSLLPKYRGAAPIQWAVLNGDKETGITTMLMNEGLDTGDILLTEKTEIGENETASELFDRLSLIGAELVLKTIDNLQKGNITPKKQDNSRATYAPMLSKDLSNIDFNRPVYEVHKKICGLSDWPCAVTSINGKRLKIYRSQIVSNTKPDAEPGEIINEKDFTVACIDGSIRLVEVQAEGSKRMKSEDYLRGKPVSRGTMLNN